jgi:superfamily II DNA/RNA helicase
MEFKDLGLSEAVLRSIEEAGYKNPTPIQEQAIPVIQMCRDVLGLAQTGTGKTGAFTMPMIDILAGGRAKARMPRSLILSPTRELAMQTSDNFVKYGKYNTLTQALIVGGTSMDEQIRNLDRGVDVLIATPGRLLDLFDRGKILLADIKILVIDEADRMMDMGFIPDLEKIVSILPPIRQTLFFSATMPPEIKRLADKFLSNPKTITVAAVSSASANVESFVVHVPHFRQKPAAFHKLYQSEEVKNAFVFCNRKRDIDEVRRFMRSKGIKAAALHGDMEQSERTEALNAFKAGETQILVCSDVAARGLDVVGMSHVFNWDVPNHPEDYVHRIGRTGRAGLSGRAFTFATPHDEKALHIIQKLIGKKIEVMNLDVGKPLPPPDKPERHQEPALRQRERHHNRHAKQNHRHRHIDDIEITPEQAPELPVDAGSGGASGAVGGFGDDVPSFLRKK